MLRKFSYSLNPEEAGPLLVLWMMRCCSYHGCLSDLFLEFVTVVVTFVLY